MYVSDMHDMANSWDDKNNEMKAYIAENQQLRHQLDTITAENSFLRSELAKKGKELLSIKTRVYDEITAISKQSRNIEGKIDCMSNRAKLLTSDAITQRPLYSHITKSPESCHHSRGNPSCLTNTRSASLSLIHI